MILSMFDLMTDIDFNSLVYRTRYAPSILQSHDVYRAIRMYGHKMTSQHGPTSRILLS